MKKIIVIILGVFLFFYCNEVLKPMIGTKEDVFAYREWLKKGNRGTMLEFLKGGYTKRSEGKESEKFVKEKAELEKQLKVQESKLALLQKQLDEALNGKGLAGAVFTPQAEDAKIKELEQKVVDLTAEVDRLRKLKAGVSEEEAESPETIFWRGKAIEVVAELQARLEQVKQYGKDAEDALQKFRGAPFEEDQAVLIQYLKNLNQAIKDSRARIIELNDLKFDTKLSDVKVRVPKEYRDFSNSLEVEIDKFIKIWRPEQFFGLLPWIVTEGAMRDKIDLIRRTNLAWDRKQSHLASAKPYEKIKSVPLEYKPSDVPLGEPSGDEGQVPPPPPPPPASGKGEDVLLPPPPPVVRPSGGAEQKVKIKQKDFRMQIEQRGALRDAIDPATKNPFNFSEDIIKKVVQDKNILTNKEALKKARELQESEK